MLSPLSHCIVDATFPCPCNRFLWIEAIGLRTYLYVQSRNLRNLEIVLRILRIWKLLANFKIACQFSRLFKFLGTYK